MSQSNDKHPSSKASFWAIQAPLLARTLKNLSPAYKERLIQMGLESEEEVKIHGKGIQFASFSGPYSNRK